MFRGERRGGAGLGRGSCVVACFDSRDGYRTVCSGAVAPPYLMQCKLSFRLDPEPEPVRRKIAFSEIAGDA